MAVANLIKFSVWHTLPGDSYNAKMVCFGEGAWSYAHVKTLFSFFLSIYQQCGHRLSWPHDTLLCVFICCMYRLQTACFKYQKVGDMLQIVHSGECKTYSFWGAYPLPTKILYFGQPPQSKAVQNTNAVNTIPLGTLKPVIQGVEQNM